jgi:hypothetical protein
VAPPPEVGLHQCAQVVGLAAEIEAPRGGAGAALELVADHARAAADIAFRDLPAPCRLERRDHVRLADVQAVHVVQCGIAGLGHDRQ